MIRAILCFHLCYRRLIEALRVFFRSRDEWQGRVADLEAALLEARERAAHMGGEHSSKVISPRAMRGSPHCNATRPQTLIRCSGGPFRCCKAGEVVALRAAHAAANEEIESLQVRHCLSLAFRLHSSSQTVPFHATLQDQLAAYRKRLQSLRESAPMYDRAGGYRAQTAALSGDTAPSRLPGRLHALGAGAGAGSGFDGTMAKAGALLGLVGTARPVR